MRSPLAALSLAALLSLPSCLTAQQPPAATGVPENGVTHQSPATAGTTAVPTPDAHLKRDVTADFQLIDWKELSSYFRALAQTSPHVKLTTEGKTTQGRDFLVAVISSKENLANLDAILSASATIADPRGKTKEQLDAALRDGKPIITITPAMHSNEVGGVPFALRFAHLLATSNDEPWKSAREQCVVVMPPTLNPDGLDTIVSWYRSTVRTPHEGSQPTELYQHYTGHDNNRDYFLLSQAETRIWSRLLYHVYRPQICWDVHQQGNSGERIFVPPYTDPLNPNLDPAVVAATYAIGTRAVYDMTRAGLTGIATGVSYDMWWHGGNRSVPVRHNMVGILTEAASANFASPVFQRRADLKPVVGKAYGPSNQYLAPWPGGWWRLADIVDYELAFARSLFSTVTREPRTFLATTLEANQRTIASANSGVRGWVIPATDRDPPAVRRLVDALLQTGIEIHTLDADATLDARTYPKGSILIRRDQPWSNHVKDLFDIQRFPEGQAPYDVAGWTLPLLLGVQRVELMSPLPDTVKATKITSPEDATTSFAGDPRLKSGPDGALSANHSDTWTKVVESLKDNRPLTFLTRGANAGLFVPAADNPDRRPAGSITVKKLPRIAVYSPWSGEPEEGWLRWVFDTYKIPYTTVRNEHLRAANLNADFDVLILPPVAPRALDRGRPAGSVPEQYAGGLSPDGAVAVDGFVRAGGTLVAIQSAARWSADLLQIALPRPTGFSCPGSILRSIPDADHPLTAGLPASLPLYFSGGAGASASADESQPSTRPASTRGDRGGDRAAAEVLLTLAPAELLLSGYLDNPRPLQNQPAWLRARVGKGHAHLFTFQPHYRAWSQTTFPLLFRATLLDADRN